MAVNFASTILPVSTWAGGNAYGDDITQKIALALMEKQFAGQPQQIQSPWQGAAEMANSALAGMMYRKAQQGQLDSLSNMGSVIFGGKPAPAPSSGGMFGGIGKLFGGGDTNQGTVKTASLDPAASAPYPAEDETPVKRIAKAMMPQSSPKQEMASDGLPAPVPPANVPMTQYAGAISGIESGGKYDLLGPQTKSGDRAYGKYQVMGANIPEWTKEALGQAMTPAQFLASPQAQDAVFNYKFGQYAQKYGPEGAAKAWFAGEAGMKNPNAKDVLGTTVSSYARQFDRNLANQGPVQVASANPDFVPQPQSPGAAVPMPIPRPATADSMAPPPEMGQFLPYTPPPEGSPVQPQPSQVAQAMPQAASQPVMPQTPDYNAQLQGQLNQIGTLYRQAIAKGDIRSAQMLLGMGQQLRMKLLAPPELKPQSVGDHMFAFDPRTGKTLDVTPPGFKPDTTGIREYNLYADQQKAAGKPVLPFEQYKIEMEQAMRPQNNIAVNAVANPILEGISKQFIEMRDKANSAVDSIRVTHELRKQLDSGMFTGSLANWQIGASKLANALGLPLDQDTIGKMANSETFMSVAARNVMTKIKSLGSGSGISDADREYAAKAVGGQVTLNEQSMRHILDINEKLDRYAIQRNNQMADKILGSEYGKQLGPASVLLRIDEPPAYAPQAPAAPAAQVAPAAPQGQPSRQDIENEMRRRGLLK